MGAGRCSDKSIFVSGCRVFINRAIFHRKIHRHFQFGTKQRPIKMESPHTSAALMLARPFSTYSPLVVNISSSSQFNGLSHQIKINNLLLRITKISNNRKIK
jgi:hypothetical protein